MIEDVMTQLLVEGETRHGRLVAYLITMIAVGLRFKKAFQIESL